ncbi:hypothetical protein MDA_GLEAN10017571 [Myotis davidii]|uniref:Uncharacterized protein n=1 Tax=Myotis davidii TaxID=225400 RepID=L5M2Q3_MYODS|nr:hypothetical protein MDA_GLEAN10017571 [Myotis davidii]
MAETVTQKKMQLQQLVHTVHHPDRSKPFKCCLLFIKKCISTDSALMSLQKAGHHDHFRSV